MHETLYKQKKEPLAQPPDPQSLDQGLARQQGRQCMQAASPSNTRQTHQQLPTLAGIKTAIFPIVHIFRRVLCYNVRASE